MPPRPASAAFGWLIVALLVTGSAAASDEPLDWLRRMNQALTTRNYDGVFFHVQGGKVETLRIIHRVQDGQVSERLVSLDGSGREFIRAGNELTCYLPDVRTVVVEKRASDGPLLGNLPTFDDGAAQFYDIKGVERTRIMGRDARVISVTPKDDFRYGYRLWIDEATAMPLKTQLCDGRGDVIEQIVFANLALPERIPDTAFRPQVSTDGFRWLRNQASVEKAGTPLAWQALRLPPGFRMTVRGAQVMPGGRDPVDHLVFSDGLASVSVFVEPRSADRAAAPAAPAAGRVGSSSAFSTVVDGHRVTAVGEVPPNTVRFIANSLKAQQPPAMAAPPPR